MKLNNKDVDTLIDLKVSKKDRKQQRRSKKLQTIEGELISQSLECIYSFLDDEDPGSADCDSKSKKKKRKSKKKKIEAEETPDSSSPSKQDIRKMKSIRKKRLSIVPEENLPDMEETPRHGLKDLASEYLWSLSIDSNTSEGQSEPTSEPTRSKSEKVIYTFSDVLYIEKSALANAEKLEKPKKKKKKKSSTQSLVEMKDNFSIISSANVSRKTILAPVKEEDENSEYSEESGNDLGPELDPEQVYPSYDRHDGLELP